MSKREKTFAHLTLAQPCGFAARMFKCSNVQKKKERNLNLVPLPSTLPVSPLFWLALLKLFGHLHICTFNLFSPCKSSTYRMCKNSKPDFSFCTFEHLQLLYFFYNPHYTFAQTSPDAALKNVQMFQCASSIYVPFV